MCVISAWIIQSVINRKVRCLCSVSSPWSGIISDLIMPFGVPSLQVSNFSFFCVYISKNGMSYANEFSGQCHGKVLRRLQKLYKETSLVTYSKSQQEPISVSCKNSQRWLQCRDEYTRHVLFVSSQEKKNKTVQRQNMSRPNDLNIFK